MKQEILLASTSRIWWTLTQTYRSNIKHIPHRSTGLPAPFIAVFIYARIVSGSARYAMIVRSGNCELVPRQIPRNLWSTPKCSIVRSPERICVAASCNIQATCSKSCAISVGFLPNFYLTRFCSRNLFARTATRSEYSVVTTSSGSALHNLSKRE